MKPRKPRSPGQNRDQNNPNSPRRHGAGQRQRTPRYDNESLQRTRGLSIHTMDQSVIQSFENSETLTGRRAKSRNPNQSPRPDFRADQRAEGRRMAAYADDDADDNIGNQAPGGGHQQRPRGPGRDRSIKVWRPEGEQGEGSQAPQEARANERSNERAPHENGDQNRGERGGRFNRNKDKGRQTRAPGSGLHRSRRRFQREEGDAVVGAEVAEKPANAQRKEETRIHGVNACRTMFDKRKEDVIRVYLTQERSYEFNDVMKHCVENRLAYHIIPADELSRAAESEHHEGICFLIRKRVTLQLEEWLATLPKKGGVRAIALDQVGNSHNIGAILRTAAHFGVDAVLFSSNSPIHNGSAARTAEGGFESLTLVEYSDSLAATQALHAAGFEIIATSGEGDTGLYDQKLPKRGVIFFGEEKGGLNQPLIDAADVRLSIPGSGAVQSLNVSCATAVILGEWNRTTKKKASSAESAATEGVVTESAE